MMLAAWGSNAVTVDEIASAAEVSKVTVFNYFPRKEDLFLDYAPDVTRLLRQAVRDRPEGQSPVDALRALVDRLGTEKHPFARIEAQTVGWWRIVAASPSLQGRVREIGDEAVEDLAHELDGAEPGGPARLVAGLGHPHLAHGLDPAEGLRVFEREGR